MIDAISLRPLLLQSTTQDNAYISAASGLSWVGEHLYVIADDALQLGWFNALSDAPGTALTLLPGELPQDPKARKAQKPDFEVLTYWSEYSGAAGGALFAFGSGSKKNRSRGVLIPLDIQGTVAGAVQVFDLANLYAHLETRVAALNIEGALFTPTEFWMFQRGNSAQGKNAIIRMPHESFLRCLQNDKATDSITLDIQVQEIALGEFNGVPLGFTDATRLDNGSILFSAAAEDTEDTYHDGQCTGSVIGLMSSEGVIQWQAPINLRCKVEGIAAQTINDQTLECLLVTDADNAAIPATLLRAYIERNYNAND